MSETLPLATVKARFSELVDRVARQQDRVIVTRNGQPAVVLVSTDDLEHEGHWSARRGPYRIIYELLEDEQIVRVIAIGHRRDVYRRR